MPKITRVCHHSPTRDDCPALYTSDDGRLFVQGARVADADVVAQMRLPADETMVEITPELLAMMTDPTTVQRIGALQAT